MGQRISLLCAKRIFTFYLSSILLNTCKPFFWKLMPCTLHCSIHKKTNNVLIIINYNDLSKHLLSTYCGSGFTFTHLLLN